MKEDYAVRGTVPPSAEIQASIDKLISRGVVDDPQKMLPELARLRARLIIQRASRRSSTPGWAALVTSGGRTGRRRSATGSVPGALADRGG
jgi:hypothetical protein